MADSVTASLGRRLATRTPGQLATLIRRWRERDPRARDPKAIADLARGLVGSRWVAAELASLSTAGHQILLAADLRGEERETSSPSGVPARARVRRDVITCVDREELLADLGLDLPGDRRDAALHVLEELADRALMWPDDDDTLVLPWTVRDHVQRYDLRLEPRGAAIVLRGYGETALERIAHTLGVDTQGRDIQDRDVQGRARWDLADAIAIRLSDEGTVRRLVASLPASAQEALFAALETGELATDACTYSVEERGHRIVESATEHHVLLLDRALVVPFVPGTALVPAEVFRALTFGVYLPFTPAPTSPLPSREVPTDELPERVRLAITAAVATVDRLLAAVDALSTTHRRAGVAPTEQTQRLATDLGLALSEVPLWIGLAREAGLIGQLDSDVLPTPAAGRWMDAPAASRAAQLLRAWQRMDEVPTWWPSDDEPRPVFVHEADATAPVLRHAILQALATLPVGCAVLPMIVPLPAGGQVPRDLRLPVYRLLVAANWFAPLTVRRSGDHERLWQTLYEAELLGVTALGTLTELGRALLDATVVTETDNPMEAIVAPFVGGAMPGAALGTGTRVVVAQPGEQDKAALLLARRLLDRATPPPSLFD